jgi:predicted HTH transcriptional regulator
MMQLNEMELKKLIQGGETNTVELKVAAPRAVEMAERLCGMANAQGGMIILGVKDAKWSSENNVCKIRREMLNCVA